MDKQLARVMGFERLDSEFASITVAVHIAALERLELQVNDVLGLSKG